MPHINFLAYPKIQPLDLVGPWEVCGIWQALNNKVTMDIVAETLEPIQCDNRLALMPQKTFQTARQADFTFIPGGSGRFSQKDNTACLEFIRTQVACNQITLSVCTGAFLLAHLELLNDREVTTYWRAIPEFKDTYPHIKICEKRIVKSGDIWSAGGISSGIDIALALIEEVDGKKRAGETQLMFEYFPLVEKSYASSNDLDNLPHYSGHSVNQLDMLPDYIYKELTKD